MTNTTKRMNYTRYANDYNEMSCGCVCFIGQVWEYSFLQSLILFRHINFLITGNKNWHTDKVYFLPVSLTVIFRQVY